MLKLIEWAKGKQFWLGGLVLAFVVGTSAFVNGGTAPAASPFQFEVTLAKAAAEGIAELGLDVPVTGRVFVIISKNGGSEPRAQIDVTGVPFWGKDVHALEEGASVALGDGDPAVVGYPLEGLGDIPPGLYYVQAFVNVYTTFERSDGHVVEMHLNSGAGQNLWRAPGNAHSRVTRIYLDPEKSGTVSLALTEVIPPIEGQNEGESLQQGNPRDTDWVKYVKLQSEPLSEFWGQPMHIGANVLLPQGYEENPDVDYPVIYLQGHFPGSRAPFRFEEEEGNDFYEFWTSDEAPRVIAVTFRDANPYYDTSYSVNSENVGPYGDAIMTELIPYIEENFRVIDEPWARVLAGGSTGGWEALAMKVWHPDFFGGTWAWCPDAVDFHYHQLVNIYEDENAYLTVYDWVTVERPSARSIDGNIRFTIQQENHMEWAIGPQERSGGQWAIWQAVFSPVGADGYPQPLWDPLTGEINPDVAEYWKAHYDITYKLQQEWEKIGPDLAGQLTLTNGDMDTYYLNQASYLLRDWLESTSAPYAAASFDFGPQEPHCWIGESPNEPGKEMSYAEFVQIVTDHVTENAPDDADLESWQY